MSCIGVSGRWRVKVFAPDGKLDRELVFPNGTTTAGINDMLSVAFNSGSQKTSWYIGLIGSSGYTALSAGDTASSHSGWTESTSYDESTRPQWVPDAPSGGVITNSTAAVFTINATVTIKGCFLISNSTKGGTSGVLWATGLFTQGDQSLVDNNTLSITYECTGTAS